MKRLAHIALLLLLTALHTEWLTAQEGHVSMVNRDTVRVYNCHTTFGEVILACNDTSAFDGWAIIETQNRTITGAIHLSGLAPGWGRLRVWDGSPSASNLLIDLGDWTSLTWSSTLTATRGTMTIHLEIHSSFSPRIIHFRNQWSTTDDDAPTYCPYSISNVEVSNIRATEADLTWNTTAPYTLVTLGDRQWVTSSRTLHIDSLQLRTCYTLALNPTSDSTVRPNPCCETSTTFTTSQAAHIGCPDATDLGSDYVMGYYGSFTNPRANIGLVYDRFNPTAHYNRHTVITDTTFIDVNTGGRLRQVCPGTEASVRLGNRNIGSEAESIEYKLHIDTTFYSILLLRYAVVLQNPDHGTESQPRFTLEILDSNKRVIDTSCGMADFTADGAIGWNTHASALWKDWTTVGFDVSPYQGQDIFVRITTYDCAHGGHYGYAYFTIECQHSSVTTAQCGAFTTNTLTAPEGFHYRWYADDPGQTLSTERSITYDKADRYYHCQLISLENADCYATMHAYLGDRYPKAIPDTLECEDLGCDGYRVSFLNRSAITGAGGQALAHHEDCESAYWDFGDGHTSTTYSPIHTYRSSGTFTVTLVAGIADNQCLDTTVMTLVVPDLTVPVDSAVVACDSVVWGGAVYWNDTVGPRLYTRGSTRCDTAYVLHLTLLHSEHTMLEADTFCYNSTYTWRGQTVGGMSLTDTGHYSLEHRFPTGESCDSVVVLPLVQLPPDTVHLEWVSDCHEKSYVLTAQTSMPWLRWTSEPTDPALDAQQGLRQVLVAPNEVTTYTVTVDHSDTGFCPTTRSVTLQPVSYPRAELRVQPELLVNDNRDFSAYNVSRNTSGHRWTLVAHGMGSDTLLKGDERGHVEHTLGMGYDSATVLLEVGNGVCLDTARKVVRVVSATIYAPNAFTPDQAINNRFTIVGEGLLEGRLTVYNRMGLLVYSSDRLAEGWDGTHDGRACPQGAYVWHLRYRTADLPGSWRAATGTVTLLR